MEKELKPGKYKHFRGGDYQVIDVAIHSETEELMVVYRPLYGDQSLWVRPFSMFTETVEYQGELVKRFSYVAE